MSTLASTPTRPAADVRTPPLSHAGTGSLVGLTLRRERIPLLVWVVGIAAVAASTFSAFVSLYPTEFEREALALSVTANPAFLALTGPVASTSIGGLTAWRIGVLGTTLFGLMAIVTVVLQLPQGLMDLSPYSHVPPVPAEPINWPSHRAARRRSGLDDRRAPRVPAPGCELSSTDCRSDQ